MSDLWPHFSELPRDVVSLAEICGSGGPDATPESVRGPESGTEPPACELPSKLLSAASPSAAPVSHQRFYSSTVLVMAFR